MSGGHQATERCRRVSACRGADAALYHEPRSLVINWKPQVYVCLYLCRYLGIFASLCFCSVLVHAHKIVRVCVC